MSNYVEICELCNFKVENFYDIMTRNYMLTFKSNSI